MKLAAKKIHNDFTSMVECSFYAKFVQRMAITMDGQQYAIVSLKFKTG